MCFRGFCSSNLLMSHFQYTFFSASARGIANKLPPLRRSPVHLMVVPGTKKCNVGEAEYPPLGGGPGVDDHVTAKNAYSGKSSVTSMTVVTGMVFFPAGGPMSARAEDVTNNA